MPAETGPITFTGPEVLEALAACCEATGRALPNGGTKGLTLLDGADSKIAIEPEGEAPKITFYESEAAAALLAYCRKKRIPIARRSTKPLECKQGAVTLRLDFG